MGNANGKAFIAAAETGNVVNLKTVIDDGFPKEKAVEFCDEVFCCSFVIVHLLFV